MPPKTPQPADQLVAWILNYESDLFSAKGRKLTAAEARKIATSLINQWANEKLSPDLLKEELSKIR